jgi:hypothetical protein
MLMEPEIAEDVDHCWNRLINLANTARTDPRDAAAEIVRSFMACGNQVHIGQLQNMVNRELARRRGERVLTNILQRHNIWVNILITTRNTLSG